MKRTILLIAGFTCLFTYSCKKKENPPNIFGIGVPYGNDSLMPTQGVIMSRYVIENISGAFIVNNQIRIVKDTSGRVVNYDNPWQQAIFISNAGNVTLNNSALMLSGTTSSYWSNEPALWKNNSSNTWRASGNRNIPAIDHTTGTGYPEFRGILPDSIEVKATTRITCSFTPANTGNADSGYIILYSYKNKSIWFSNIVSANGGAASIQLSGADYRNAGNRYFMIRDKVCYGGLLEVVLFNHEVHTFDNKPFAFVRQRQVLHNVVFY